MGVGAQTSISSLVANFGGDKNFCVVLQSVNTCTKNSQINFQFFFTRNRHTHAHTHTHTHTHTIIVDSAISIHRIPNTYTGASFTRTGPAKLFFVHTYFIVCIVGFVATNQSVDCFVKHAVPRHACNHLNGVVGLQQVRFGKGQARVSIATRCGLGMVRRE